MTYNKNDWESHDLITTGKMNNIEDGIQTALERATFGHGGAEMPSEGLHIESYINLGDPMPPNPLSGDIVYVKDGDDYIIYQYDGAMWVLQVNPKFAQRLQKNLLEAKVQTETLISENQVNVDKTINEVKEEQKNLQDGLNNLDTNAQDYANKALADARADIATTAQDLAEKVKQETDDRVKAVSDATAHADSIVATAKSDLANTIAKETSDRNAAVTALDTKAKGYADAAKADAISASATALNTAKTDLTTSLNKEVTDRTKAITDLDTKAQGYATQAKTDAIATANGAVAKEATDRQKAITDLDAKSTGAINQAKTDAQSALNALQVGGRNWLLDTKMPNTATGANVSNQITLAYTLASGMNSGKMLSDWGAGAPFTISFDWAVTGATLSGEFGPQFWSQPYGFGAPRVKVSSTNTSGHYVYTSTSIASNWAGTSANIVDFRLEYLQGAVTIKNFKLEKGNKATDYTQAPEDIVLDYTTKDNIISQSLTQYQTTNDGKVTKAQSDATQALGLVATKVSQTDYNTKTGDLDSKYTSVKQTVDTQTTDIADIKKTNTSQDAKLNTIQSDVNGTKQSISDIQTEQGKQSTKINTIQTDVSGTKQDISDIKDANGVQDGKIASISTTVDGLSSSFSTYKTTNDGKVAKAQADITANATAISQKVSQTAYDAKTGQLQTDLNATTTTANQARTDIVSIKQKDGDQDARMTTIESDASGVKTTVSDLQTAQGKQSGDISTLQQRANGFEATVTKVNNLQVGGRNLVIKDKLVNGWMNDGVVASGSSAHAMTTDFVAVVPNSNLVAQIWYDNTINTADNYLRVAFYDSNKTYITRTPLPATSSTTYNKWLIATPANTAFVRVSFDWLGDGYGHAKLEIGNMPTAYTPAPEDVDSTIAKAQLTADNASLALSNYKTDADGRISRAQADIVVNANAITQKVSQTEYNAKTGDLTTKVNTAQSTADSAKSTISAYQTSNDGRVATAESNITQNTKAIATKVSQTVYDAKTNQLQTDLNTTTTTANKATTDIVSINKKDTAQDARMTTIESDASGVKTTVSNLQSDLGKVSGSISTLQQRADGFDATVTKVNTQLNDLSQVNMVVNSEFSPDLAGWYIRGTQTLLSDGPNSSDVGFNKSGHVVLDTTNGTGTGNVNYTSMAYPVTPSSIISVSVELKASVSGTNPQIGFIYYDANMNAVAGQRGGVPVTTDYKLFKYTGTAIPATAKYVSFDILISNVYKARYIMSQPMMVIGSTVGAYVQGQYNNNGATAKAQLTADNATTTINNYKISNDGRVASAESNISQNATAITQKVSQTDYDQKTGQLQTDLNTTTNTANTAKQDISTIKNDNTKRDEKINTLESDSTETKRTISKLSGDLNTVSGDVSTLKQTAQGFEATVTKVNNMSVGGRNLFLNSKTLWNVANNGNSSTKVTFDDTTNMWHITAPAPVTAGRGIYFYQTSNTSKPLVKGDKWAMSIDIKGTGMLREFGAEGSTNQTQPTGPIPSEWTRLSSTGTAVSTGAIIIYFGAGADTTQALDVYVKLPKLELGTMATAWSPAPEDVDSSISSVKQTADSASTAITNYKVSNDGRVSAAEGNIKTNADAITQKVSIVDYNTNNGTVSTRIGKIETANDKITQSVSSLTTQVNAMGQINQLFNTEFSPDFAGWGYWDGDMKKSTSNITNSRLVISNRYKGSNKILTDSSIDARYVTSTIPISISSNQPMVARVTADSDKAGSTLRLHISFHDANGIQTGNVYTVGNLTTTPQDIVVAFNGPLPPNTVSAYLVVMVVGKAAWTQPMVIYGDTIGAYTPGAYNSTQKIASQQITIDSISDVVSNPTTGLTKRVQTAEGTLNQVQGTDIPALQKATYWQAPNGYDLNTYMAQGSTFFRDTIARTNAPTTSTKWMYLVVERTPNGDRITQTAWYDTQTDAKITYRRQYAGSWGAWYANDNDSVTSIKQTNSAIQQEVKDRTNGDSNTLTQAKDFTTSSITSSETGMKSLITQTSDSIVAQIGSTGVRYVRINGQGNQDNQGTHFMRVSLFDSSGKDLLLGKTATVSGPNSPYFGGNNGGNGATDGNVNTYNAIYPEPNANNFMVYDLGAVTYTSQKFEVKMWTNYRTYKGVTIQVSPDNKSWRTVLQEDVKSVSGDITKPDTTVNLGNTSSATQLALLKDNWSIGIAGNTGALASGIAGDANAMAVVSPKVIINSPQTQITGKLTAAQIDTKELSALSANLGNVSSGSITNPINQAWSAGTGATLLGTTVIDNRGINMNADIKTASNPKLYSETVSISPDTGIKFSWRDYTGGTVLPPVPLDMSMSSAGIVASSGKQYVSIVGNSITADNETAGTATTMSAMVSNPDGGINAGGAQSSAYIRYVTGQNDTQNLPLVMGLERIGNIVMVSFNFVTYGSTIRADAIQMNGPKIPVGFRPVDNVHIQAHANNGGTTIGTITFTITPDGKVLQTSPAINGIARIMGSATYLTYMIGAQAGFVVKDAQGNTTW